MAAADTPNHLRPQDWDELLLGQASEQASAHLDVCGQCRSFPIASAATHLQRQAYCHPQHLCDGLGSRCRFSFLRRPLVRRGWWPRFSDHTYPPQRAWRIIAFQRTMSGAPFSPPLDLVFGTAHAWL